MSSATTDRLMELAQELLDAHCDTVCLADSPSAGRWDAHLDYLRALQRIAKRELAAVADEAPYSGSDQRAASGAP